MDNELTFERQIVKLKKAGYHTLRNIRKIKSLLNSEHVKIIVNSLVLSCLDYCNGLYIGIKANLIHQLQLLQNTSAKAVTGKYKKDHLGNDLKALHWLDFKKRIIFKIALIAHKAVLGFGPKYIQDMFTYAHHGYTPKLIVPSFNTKFGKRSFSVIAPRLYNNLPLNLKLADLKNFKVQLKTFLFILPSSDVEKLLNNKY